MPKLFGGLSTLYFMYSLHTIRWVCVQFQNLLEFILQLIIVELFTSIYSYPKPWLSNFGTKYVLGCHKYLKECSYIYVACLDVFKVPHMVSKY